MTTVADCLVFAIRELKEDKSSSVGVMYWDPKTASYVYKRSGRRVSESKVIELMDKYTERALTPEMERLTERMLDGKLSLQDWQQRVAKELKDAWIVKVQAGRGGKAQTTRIDYSRAGGRLKGVYAKLNRFAKQIENEELSRAQILARAKQYSQAPNVAYWDGKTEAAKNSKFTEERRVLNPAEHCDDCVGYANEGWKPIGYFPEPGDQSVCGDNCKCVKEFRVDPVTAKIREKEQQK